MCKYAETCPLKKEDSFTCKKEIDCSYCGKYREFEAQNA